MASTLLSTILCLNLVASVSYLVFRALAFAGRKHISEKWRYNCITIIMCLYVIPFYKLLPGFPQAFTNVQPISVVGKNIVSGTNVVSPENPVSIFTEASSNIIQNATLNISFDWQKCVLVIWIVFVVTLATWNVLGFLRFRYHIQQTQEVSHAMLQDIANDCASKLGIKKKVDLRLYTTMPSPMLIGFFTPIIVVPRVDLQLDDAQMILAHELVHFKHHDLWRKLFAVILQTVYWFNPVVHLMKRELDRLAETSCDEQVVCQMSPAERKKYGHLLISYTTVFRIPSKSSGIAFVSTRKRLERRLLTMLNSNQKSRKTVAIALACALGASCLAMSAFAVELPSSIDVPNAELMDVADVKLGDAGDAHIVESANGFMDLSTMKLSTESNDAAKMIESTTGFADLSQFNLSTDTADGMAFYEGTVTAKAGEAVLYASGSLSSGKGYAFDAQNLVKGQKVTINATWTPTSSKVQIGLINNKTGYGLVKTVTNGSGSVSFEITGDSNFSIFIGNVSPSSIRFDVSYIVN